jgi:hypothetical protein
LTRFFPFHANRYPLRLKTLERDDFSSNRRPTLSFCSSMIFSENRCPLCADAALRVRIMLERLRRHSTSRGGSGNLPRPAA